MASLSSSFLSELLAPAEALARAWLGLGLLPIFRGKLHLLAAAILFLRTSAGVVQPFLAQSALLELLLRLSPSGLRRFLSLLAAVA